MRTPQATLIADIAQDLAHGKSSVSIQDQPSSVPALVLLGAGVLLLSIALGLVLGGAS
jgi:hypothetical protein